MLLWLHVFSSRLLINDKLSCYYLSGDETEANDERIKAGKEEATNESLPPSGYVVAGKMKIGSITVPAPNSAHLRRDLKKAPFRSESINSSTSSTATKTESIVSESVSSRLMPHEEVNVVIDSPFNEARSTEIANFSHLPP